MENNLLPSLIAGGLSVILIFGVYKVLRSFYKVIFYFLSLYLLSLFTLAKFGFIDIHLDKFQQILYQISNWFNTFWQWIVDYLNQKSV